MAFNARYVGKEGAVFLTAADDGTLINRVAWTFNWTLEIQQETTGCAVKTEVSETYALGGVSTRVTCERFQAISHAGSNAYDFPSVMAAGTIADAPLTLPAYGSGNGTARNDLTGATVNYFLYGIDLNLTGGKPAAGSYIKGTGFLVRSQIQNPRGASTEQFEIVGTSLPLIVDQSAMTTNF